MKLDMPSGTWTLAFLALYVVFAGIASFAVYRDAKRRTDLFLELHPVWWGGITFLTGAITGIAAYWLIHYSSLRRLKDNPNNADSS